jgi:NAD(P)-dependent dehydrogenase (short-subunit alcohol dehydrogenase family)
VDHFGKLNIAVVNAGILLLGDVATVNVDDLDRMLNVNVRGVFLAIQAAAACLILTAVVSLRSAVTQQCEADIRARAFTQ